MVLRFLDAFASRLYPAWLRDRGIAETPLERRKRTEQELEASWNSRDDKEKRKKEEERTTSELMTLLLVSEEFRRAVQGLNDDIDDAIRAVRLAAQRAECERDAAREALELVEHNSLLLPDGGRAYFTRGGDRLMTPNGIEVTDRAAIGQANTLRDAHPDATDYETYVERWDAFSKASARVEELGTALNDLDDFQKRIQSGAATKDDLATAREDLTRILDMLPVEVRSEYERIHAERRPAYRDAESGPVSVLGPLTSTDVNRVPAVPEIAPTETPKRPPAYKPAPEF